jgi:hypothetical protein
MKSLSKEMFAIGSIGFGNKIDAIQHRKNDVLLL